MNTPQPVMDIFCGFPNDKDAVWIITVSGLAVARTTMERMAAARPAPYFIRFATSRSVFAQIDTRARTIEETKSKSNAA